MNKQDLFKFLEEVIAKGEVPKKLPKGFKDVPLGSTQWKKLYEQAREKPEVFKIFPSPKKPIKELPRPKTKAEWDYQVQLYKKGLLKTPPVPFEVGLVESPDLLDVIPSQKMGEIAGKGVSYPLWRKLLELHQLKKQAEEVIRQTKLPAPVSKRWERIGEGVFYPLWEKIVREFKTVRQAKLPVVSTEEIPTGKVISAEGMPVGRSASEVATTVNKSSKGKDFIRKALRVGIPTAGLFGLGSVIYNLFGDENKSQGQQPQVNVPEKTQTKEQGKKKTTTVGTTVGEATMGETTLEEPKLDLRFWREAPLFDLFSNARSSLEQAKQNLQSDNINNILKAQQDIINSIVSARNSYDELKKFVIQGITEVLSRPLELPPDWKPDEKEQAIRGIVSGLLGLAMAFAPPSKVDFYAGILAGYQDALLQGDERRKQEALQQYKINLERDISTRNMQLQALQTQMQYLQGLEQKDVENLRLLYDYNAQLLEMELAKISQASKEAENLQKLLLIFYLRDYLEEKKHQHELQKEQLKAKERERLEGIKAKHRERLEGIKGNIRKQIEQMKAQQMFNLFGGK